MAIEPIVLPSNHSQCCVCGAASIWGGPLQFVRVPEGVMAEVALPATLQGYDQTIHGGVVAMLLDSAMTWAVFATGAQGVTADLRIRYRLPVRAGQVQVFGQVTNDPRTATWLKCEARIVVAEKTLVWARGLFRRKLEVKSC
jgi:uncharacterized protein (TIGR00369 family)